MPKRKPPQTALKLLNRGGHWLAVGLGGLVILVVTFVVSMLAVEFWITWPSAPERHFRAVMEQYRHRHETVVPLTALIPTPWQKVCLVQDYEEATAEAIRQKYGHEVDVRHLSGEFQIVRDGEGALVVYPAGEAPWAMRVMSGYFNDLQDGDCVDRNYQVTLGY